MSKRLDVLGNDSDPLATWRKFIVGAAPPLCNGSSRILELIMRLVWYRTSYRSITVLAGLSARFVL